MRHNDVLALRLLQAAVDASPAGSAGLPRYLYWLSVALLRLGRTDLAIKSLATAKRLVPRSHAARLHERHTNGYGMLRSACVEHDDFRAFFSLQANRYLHGRRGFRDELERDLVSRAIADAWISLGAESALDGLSCADKLRRYREIVVDVPFSMDHGGARVVCADFKLKRALAPEELCTCGSGLAFVSCCGRTATARKPING